MSQKNRIATFVPAEYFASGEFICDALEARGWTQADLAAVMKRPLQMIEEIISAKRRITDTTARELGQALGIDAEFWIRAEALYWGDNDDNRRNALSGALTE